jgi:hypothetical protein
LGADTVLPPCSSNPRYVSSNPIHATKRGVSMKKLIQMTLTAIAISLAGGVASPSFAPRAQAEEFTAITSGQNCTASGCYAYTRCPNGSMIQCRVYSNPYRGQSCSWWVWPYQAVRCSGFDSWGRWQDIQVSCWR